MPAADEAIARALSLISESFITASGPGGQNVNKVASAVQLRLDIYALRLPVPVFHRLRQLAGSRMTAKGELLLTAQRFRTQEANRQDALARLQALVDSVSRPPRPRRATRPTLGSQRRRLESKSRRSGIKALRARPADTQ